MKSEKWVRPWFGPLWIGSCERDINVGGHCLMVSGGVVKGVLPNCNSSGQHSIGKVEWLQVMYCRWESVM